MPDLLLSTTTAVQLATHAGSAYTTISTAELHSLPVSPISESHSLRIFLATSNCMDNRHYGQDFTSRRLRHQDSHASLPLPQQAVAIGQQPYSSPLPQAQWSKAPLPYRPRDWVDPADQCLPPLSQAQQHEWRMRPRTPGNALSGSPASAASAQDSKRKRRPRGLRDLVSRSTKDQEDAPADYALLYPQMSPYDDHLSPYSAPGELEHVRSVSQPNSASYLQSSFQESEPIPMQIPRSPTYPPAGSRAGRPRMHSHSGVTDAAFDDEADFRLFVEATAGLGPEMAFRHPHSNSSSSSSRQRSNNGKSRSGQPEQVGSPVENTLTPTTARALQQLAQMPQASSSSSQRISPPQRQRLQTSTSGLDLWLQPPSGGPSPGDVSPLEEIQPDDELPDYASSQAQAQAAQRVEATRRAQELQRKWQQSGGQRGRYD